MMPIQWSTLSPLRQTKPPLAIRLTDAVSSIRVRCAGVSVCAHGEISSRWLRLGVDIGANCRMGDSSLPSMAASLGGLAHKARST